MSLLSDERRHKGIRSKGNCYIKQLVTLTFDIYENCATSVTYVWSALGRRTSNNLSLPKMSNHNLLMEWPQLSSSRRSKFWSRSRTDSRCAKNGTTTAWTRFHRVCLQRSVLCQLNTIQWKHCLLWVKKKNTWMSLPLARRQCLLLLWWPSCWQCASCHHELTAASVAASLRSEEIHLAPFKIAKLTMR